MSGPSIDPCVTPEIAQIGNLLNQFKISPDSPYWESFLIRSLWSTVSKAWIRFASQRVWKDDGEARWPKRLACCASHH